MRFKKLFVGIVTGTVALGAGAGIAFAAWSASGSGSGSGAATVAQSLTRLFEFFPPDQMAQACRQIS